MALDPRYVLAQGALGSRVPPDSMMDSPQVLVLPGTGNETDTKIPSDRDMGTDARLAKQQELLRQMQHLSAQMDKTTDFEESKKLFTQWLAVGKQIEDNHDSFMQSHVGKFLDQQLGIAKDKVGDADAIQRAIQDRQNSTRQPITPPAPGGVPTTTPVAPPTSQLMSSLGRGGDTMVAHINPQEARLLAAVTGGGGVNPQTGLREFAPMSATMQPTPSPPTAAPVAGVPSPQLQGAVQGMQPPGAGGQQTDAQHLQALARSVSNVIQTILKMPGVDQAKVQQGAQMMAQGWHLIGDAVQAVQGGGATGGGVQPGTPPAAPPLGGGPPPP
jgi:hypothetical protein